MITRRVFTAGSAAFILAGCDDKPKRQPPQPQPSSTGWQFINSPGMPPVVPLDNGLPSFNFPSREGSVHLMMHSTRSLSGKVRMRYRVDGGPFYPVQGTHATVSLMFQRAGDNWSAQGPYASYRWFHAGQILAAGEHVLEVPFVEGHWRNVYGQQDPQGFEAAKANASLIGPVFGDPGAGATAHGVYGSGRFTILEWVIG